MSELERTAGGVIVCGFGGVDLPAVLRSWLRDEVVAGLILFKRNIDDLEQATKLVGESFECARASLPILTCVDQEGGRVARFGDPILRLPPMRRLADAGDSQLTRDSAYALARQLRAVGINLDFAPVLDVDTNPGNPVIGDRSFGDRPEVVIEHGLAFAEGLHAGGVLACGKHFPGHGDTDLDSHLALPRLLHDRQRLDRVELRPFLAAAGKLPSLMTAHVVFETLDSDVPATMSRRVIGELLRGELGYEGAVFSDDLEMKAVTIRHSIEEAGVLAIEAGCDLLLVCSDLDGAEGLRVALVREAERNETFHERLLEAKARADALRARAAALPPAIPMQSALQDDFVRALQKRLDQIE
jgi:beta-N-acetylhexosaminidase